MEQFPSQRLHPGHLEQLALADLNEVVVNRFAGLGEVGLGLLSLNLRCVEVVEGLLALRFGFFGFLLS